VDGRRHVRDILRKYHREALLQVPIDMAVEEQWAGPVSHESDRSTIVGVSDAHDVADDGIGKVIRRVSRAADDVEVVPMPVDGVLSADINTTSPTMKGGFNAFLTPDRVDASAGEEF